ncbi:MAG: sigma-70 family RNA polymerase sigma factor [Acidobacteriota bacterium]
MQPEELFARHRGRVIEIARRYSRFGVPLEDLISEGAIGLLEAARRFDRRRGTRFLTCATYWIQKRILGALDRQIRVVCLPDYRLKKMRRMAAIERTLSQELGRGPTADEVGARLRPLPVWRRTGGQVRISEIRIDHGSGPAGEGPRELSDARAVSPEERMIYDENSCLVREALDVLDPRERAVIVGRFGLADGRIRSLREVGARLGLSREGVRKVELSARARIGRYLAARLGAAGAPPRRPLRRTV